MNTEDRKTQQDTVFADAEPFEALIRKFSRDTFRYLPAIFVPAGLSILSVAIFTRLFPPLDYGQYALVVASTTILTALLAGWIQQSVLRYLPKFKAESRHSEFMARLTAILASASFLVLAVFLLLFPLIRGHLDVFARFYFPAVILVVSAVLFLSLISVFQADLRSGEYAKYQVSIAVGRLSLALAYVLFISRDVVGLIIGAAAAHVILVALMARGLSLAKYAKGAHRCLDCRFLKMFALYGFPMIGWMIGGQILAISDRFIIGAFKGASQVGIYSANYNLVSMGIGLASSPILMAAHPLIMSTWEKGDREKIPRIISAFSRYYLLAIGLIAVYAGIYSREIVAIFLGEDFRSGFRIIPFVLAGYLVWGLSMYGHKGLELIEKTGIMLKLVAVCAAANILLNLIFVPKFGYFAAAVTTFASYLLYPVLVNRVTRSHIRWMIPWRTVRNVVIASTAMGIALVVLRIFIAGGLEPVLSMCAGGVVGLVVYFGLLLALGEVKAYDLKYWKARE